MALHTAEHNIAPFTLTAQHSTAHHCVQTVFSIIIIISPFSTMTRRSHHFPHNNIILTVPISHRYLSLSLSFTCIYMLRILRCLIKAYNPATKLYRKLSLHSATFFIYVSSVWSGIEPEAKSQHILDIFVYVIKMRHCCARHQWILLRV